MSTNGFNGASHMPIDTSHHAYRHGIHRNGGDERNSISSSDDGNYPSFSEAMKYEADIEDDNAALISQTLNTDGTPKRPMNAFMIFARRRRPQVSAENQAMRTGEISKILSKEWNAMPPSEKQFYQDQARQLKDTFNSKYPDYVYRRRPNHSRRPRRKQDGVDPQNSSSTSDDFGFDDSSESPTETRDMKGMDHFSNLHRAMSASDPHPDMSKFPFGGSRTDYGYPSPNPPFHPSDSSSKPFGTTSLEIGPSSLPAMSGTGPLGSQSRPSTGYSSDTGSPNSWGLPPMRPSSSSSSPWVGGDMNRSYQPVGTPKSAQFGAGWPRPPSSLSTASTSSYGMPQMMGNDAVHDNTVSPATTAASYPSHGMPSGAFYNSRQYDNQGHNMILSTSPPTHYQNGTFRDSQQYISRSSQELPSISNYSMHSTAHPGTSHIHGLPMPLHFQC